MNIPKWKANATNSIIPTNSRPFHNGDPNLASIGRVAFKPNPIKHWRKQLKPYYKTNSKQVSINMIDAPSSVSHVNNTVIDCTNNYQLLKENINLLTECDGIKQIIDGKVNCAGGTNHITRTANTKISRNYHVSHTKYLQSKCKTYERNLTLGEKIDDKENAYNPVSCSKLLMNCEKPIIYKPSNKSFMTQGAVSSSARTLKKRNNALNNNSSSLKTAYGNAPVFKMSYNPGSTGYEIKYVKGNLTDNSVTCNQTFKSCKKA